jgi:hypothetical protein
MSSLEFDVQFFPGTFHAREAYHPIFNLPQKRLLGYTGKWAGGELTPTDSYLLFLAILHSSDLVEFRVPAFRSPQTDSIIAQNMESLVRTVIKLNTVSTPSVTFPHFVISPETRFLTNVHHWIENWKDVYADFQAGTSRDYDDRKLVHREAALQRLIKNPHKPISSYAASIADWAALAGEFPEFLTISPFSRETKIPLSEYWKSIIIKCARDESLFSIPRADLEELLTHCEDKVPAGSIFSNALFKLLRHALEKQRNFLGLGDLDLSTTNYQILSESDTTESANLKAMIDSAPSEKPRQEQYPSKIAFLKAKMRYDAATRIGNNGLGE